MTSHSEERTCEDCGQKYEEQILMSGSRAIFADFSICDSCAEKAERAAKRKSHHDKALAAWEATVPKEYRKTSEDHPDYPNAIHDICQKWLKGEGIGNSDRRLFLGLVGESGKCKTRVISQVVKRMIWQGDLVTWVNSAQFQWSCQKQFIDEHSAKANKYLGIYRRSHVLVFDDIGSLKGTEIVSDTLYDLLEYRTTRELPMLWTSNEGIGEMLPGNKITELARKRSISRLAGFSNILEL